MILINLIYNGGLDYMQNYHDSIFCSKIKFKKIQL